MGPNATVNTRLKLAAELNPSTQKLEWASELKRVRCVFYARWCNAVCLGDPTVQLTGSEACLITASACREAVQKLKIPGLMQEDLLQAMFEQQMTVPTHRTCWERFRQDMASAYAQLFTPEVMQTLSSSPLDIPVSLLVKDVAVREYDFSVSVSSQGAHCSCLWYPFYWTDRHFVHVFLACAFQLACVTGKAFQERPTC